MPSRQLGTDCVSTTAAPLRQCPPPVQPSITRRDRMSPAYGLFLRSGSHTLASDISCRSSHSHPARVSKAIPRSAVSATPRRPRGTATSLNKRVIAARAALVASIRKKPARVQTHVTPMAISYDRSLRSSPQTMSTHAFPYIHSSVDICRERWKASGSPSQLSETVGHRQLYRQFLRGPSTGKWPPSRERRPLHLTRWLLGQRCCALEVFGGTVGDRASPTRARMWTLPLPLLLLTSTREGVGD